MRLDAVLSGNKFNEKFCGSAMLKQTNYNHSVKRKLEGIYFSLQLYFYFNYGISFYRSHYQHQEGINFASPSCSFQPKITALFRATTNKNITLGQCVYILKKQHGDTKRKFVGNISKTEVTIFLFQQYFLYLIISHFL